MRLSSNRILLGGVVVVAGWLGLGACTGTPVAVVDDDAGTEGGGSDATSEGPVDSTVDGPEGGSDAGRTDSGGNDGASVTDGTIDQVAPPEASADANESGAAESGADGGGAEGGGADAADEESTGEAGGGGDDGGGEGGSDAAIEASADAPIEAAGDAPAEAATCSFAGTWNMTVQTVTAVPTFCQGIMDCTNCGWQFNATSTQPSASTIDWSGVTPGATLCNAFTGPITAGGQFQTDETDCSPAGNGSTFDGQIDLATCSLTATYVYVLSSCTITMTMTGTE